jgi:hypothetical protein
VAADDADPALRELDDAFRLLAAHLETGGPPDHELRHRIAAALAAGLLPPPSPDNRMPRLFKRPGEVGVERGRVGRTE